MPLKEELDLDRPFQDVRHEAMLGIVHTSGLAAALAAKIFRRFELTEAQFNVLFALKYKDRQLSQVELGRRLVVTRATVTSVLDKLEGKGLIMRCVVPKNRRIYHVELTEKGGKLLEEVEPVYRDSIHFVLKDLGEPQLHDLMGYLESARGRRREIVSRGDDGQ